MAHGRLIRFGAIASLATSALLGVTLSPIDAGVASASKSPVQFMVITDVTTPTGSIAAQELDSYKASVSAINAAGGIHGHPLKMIVCDTQSNPTTTETCATTAAASHVNAVLAGTGSTAPFDATLAKADIADIGAGLSAPLQFASANVFPLWAGGIGSISGIGTFSGYLKCQKLVAIAAFPPADAAETPELFSVIKGVATKEGVAVGTLVQAPSGLPDYSSYIANAQSQGATCLGIAATGADEVGLIKSARQSDPKAKIITVSDFLPPASVKSLGSLADGVYAVSLAYPASSAASHPLVAKWVHDIKKYSAKPSYTDIDANQWAAVQLFAYVADHLKTINNTTVYNYLDHLDSYNPGVTPVVSYGESAPAGGLGPRMFSPYVLFGHYSNGKLIANENSFVNFATGQPATLIEDGPGELEIPENRAGAPNGSAPEGITDV